MIIPVEIKNTLREVGLNFAQLVKEDGRFRFYALGLHDDKDNVIPSGLPFIVRFDTESHDILILSPSKSLEFTKNL